VPVRAQDIVTEALSWVGTPFGHQQRLKGVQVDCVNFIAEVAKATRATPDVDFERNYKQRADDSGMLDELTKYMVPVGSLEEALPGDVIALCDEQLKRPDKPRHLGFLTTQDRYPKMVHASERGVRHHRIDLKFRRRIHSIWRVSGLEYD
jgi:cell wall-associated NlpC family hydrolase